MQVAPNHLHITWNIDGCTFHVWFHVKLVRCFCLCSSSIYLTLLPPSTNPAKQKRGCYGRVKECHCSGVAVVSAWLCAHVAVWFFFFFFRSRTGSEMIRKYVIDAGAHLMLVCLFLPHFCSECLHRFPQNINFNLICLSIKHFPDYKQDVLGHFRVNSDVAFIWWFTDSYMVKTRASAKRWLKSVHQHETTVNRLLCPLSPGNYVWVSDNMWPFSANGQTAFENSSVFIIFSFHPLSSSFLSGFPASTHRAT